MDNVFPFKPRKSTRSWKRTLRKMGVNLKEFAGDWAIMQEEMMIINLLVAAITLVLTGCALCASFMFFYVVFLETLTQMCVYAYEKLVERRGIRV